MIKYFDIFAGIGGFRSGLEKAGGFKCVGYCEIDKYAKKAYETLYDTEGEVFYDDARKIDPNELPDLDLIWEDSLAKAFQSLENGKDSAIPEELSSLRSPGLPPLKNLNICSLKMFPVSYRTTKAGRLRPSSVRWMNWGTMSYGKCLTAQILVCPNPEKECILSDFIEKSVPEKYCLSRRRTP